MSSLHVEKNETIKEDDDQLANEIALLAGQLNAGECRFLKLIGEFDLRLGWAGAGIKSCAHWLNWKCGISMGAAREKICSSRALATLPEINDAFEKGELSYSKVRAMTRVATPENENYLMMIAEYGTAQHMEKLVKQYKRVKHLMDIGRRSRIIPPAMSRALAIRDGGCQFPGCCESRYVEGHHIIHWANGGETKMENLVTLCRYHHQELHRGSFFLTLLPPLFKAASASQKAQAFADRLVFTSGDSGYVIHRNLVNFSSSDCDFSKLQDELPDSINAETAVCHWTGKRMDYGMGIDGLLWADGRRG